MERHPSIFIAMCKAAGRVDELIDMYYGSGEFVERISISYGDWTAHTEEIFKPYLEKIKNKLHFGETDYKINQVVYTYKGQLNEKGEPTGYGKEELDKTTIEGTFLNGKIHGRGKFFGQFYYVFF